MRIATFSATACAVLALALGGCELREDADKPANLAAEPDTAPAEDGGEAAAPPEAEETVAPAASIIREDALPGPIVKLPPEPLAETVPFGDGGADLTEGAERVLAGILESEAMRENWPIVLRGHTDSAGNDRANLRVSRARAEAVAAWLVERGVDDARITVVEMGEQNPVAPNALPDGEPNEEGRASNRRVEVEIAPPPARPARPASDAPAAESADPA